MSNWRGTTFLGLSLLVFILALGAAGYVALQLKNKNDSSQHALEKITEDTSEPLPEHADALAPFFTLDPSLSDNRLELNSLLYEPLRHYYATVNERLDGVNVIVSDDIEHTTEVVLSLFISGTQQELKFFYDRIGDSRDGSFPKWEKEMLENTI
jgi:hypothetical protein